MNRDLMWLLFFLMLLFIMWYSQGGTFQSGIKFEPPQQSGANNYDFFNSGETITTSVNGTLRDSQAASSYKDQIIIRASAVATTNPQQEYITIRANYDNKNPINITGWVLKNNNNEVATIGQGSYLPYSARINTTEDIILKPGNEAVIVTGKSPIGTNFQINTCVEYFNQFQNFIPKLTSQCPYTSSVPGLYNLNDNQCIDYIESLPRCQMQTNMPWYLQNECRQFINEHLNYNGCVNDYKNKKDFYSGDWRIYLGKSTDFWKDRRGSITIFDAMGNLVERVSY